MKTVIEMAGEAGLLPLLDEDCFQSMGTKNFEATKRVLKRFAELVRADEREALETLYTDAHLIFNNPPGETSQDVRDVIEWYATSIRARGQRSDEALIRSNT